MKLTNHPYLTASNDVAAYGADLRKSLIECNVAENLQNDLIHYFTRGRLPGSFLTACLENDLKRALGSASTKMWDYVHNVVCFLYWHVPQSSWGSPEKVKAFIDSFDEVEA